MRSLLTLLVLASPVCAQPNEPLVMQVKTGIDRGVLIKQIRPGQIVIDLVNLEKSRRLEHNGSYEGICW